MEYLEDFVKDALHEETKMVNEILGDLFNPNRTDLGDGESLRLLRLLFANERVRDEQPRLALAWLTSKNLIVGFKYELIPSKGVKRTDEMRWAKLRATRKDIEYLLSHFIRWDTLEMLNTMKKKGMSWKQIYNTVFL